MLITAASAAPAAHQLPDQYVPNQVIIKFRPAVADTLEEQFQLNNSSHLTLSPHLDRLNTTYKVTNIKPVFKNFRKRHQQINALRAKNKTLLTKKQKHILARLKRAPKHPKLPDLDRIYKLELQLHPGQSLHDAVAAYNNHPDVEYARLNYIVSICKTPSDPLYPLQWPLNNVGQDYPVSGRYNSPPGTPDSDIDATDAWDRTTGASDIIVAVVDTGVDYTHRDLHNNMWINEAEANGADGVDDDGNGSIDDIYGYDFFNDDGSPIDDHGHGTHCAGIIAARGDNALDITGICWDARIMAVKFLSADGRGNLVHAAQSLYYAVDNGADVISNSWGGIFPAEIIQEAVDYAHSQGVVMVAAAGNSGNAWPFWPAYYENMMAVAATDSDDHRASFSNYGPWVDIAAPGVDILSLRAENTAMGTTYDAFTTIAAGTSMACPHVSAACAILLSIDSGLSADQLQNALMQTADPIAPGICLSGRLNLCAAILRILGPQGTIWLDRDVYSCSDLVEIKLFDTDLSTNATQEVTVSTDEGDFETVILTETPTPGIFVGTISTTSGAPNLQDAELQLSHGQTITAAYYDVNDGSGNPATATDSATADCQEPLVFNIEIDALGPEPTVTFQTDQPTTARVLYAQACGAPDYMAAADPILTTTHTITLFDLLPETDYFFLIEANDYVRNQTTDDNAASCYTFTTDAPGDIYVPAQYPTIQQAIDRSWDGGTVWVADGTYTGQGNRDIDFKARAITLRSQHGPQNCIIDCQATEQNPNRAFNFRRGEDANSILAGFTIKNGYASGTGEGDAHGGAIRCKDSQPTITNCIFTQNSAAWDAGAIQNVNSDTTITDCAFIENSALGNDGGAINNHQSSPTITNCTFTANSAYDWGGAIRNVYSAGPNITSCTFSENLAKGDGGAIYNYDNSNPTITKCTFTRNSALTNDGGAMSNYASSPMITNSTFTANSAYDWAGAICSTFSSSPTLTNCIFTANSAGGDGGAICNWEDSNAVIINCTFAQNYAPNGNALACDSYDHNNPGDLQLTNCILADGGNEICNNDGSNITITYSNIQAGYPGHGNIDADPCFVHPGYWADANDTSLLVEPNDPNALWVDGDYHLLNTSPCINAGDPNHAHDPNQTDIDGQPRIFDDRIDMGADEFVPPIEVPMKFTPQAINPSSKGKWLKAHFILPEGFTVHDVDANTPAIILPLGIESEYIDVFLNRDHFVEVKAAFPRTDFCPLPDFGPALVTVEALLTTRQPFRGTDSIRIINHNFNCLAAFVSFWLQTDCTAPHWCDHFDLDRNSTVNFLDFALFDTCCIEITTQ